MRNVNRTVVKSPVADFIYGFCCVSTVQWQILSAKFCCASTAQYQFICKLVVVKPQPGV
ncbi:hypothetical protein V6Z12_D02G240600 [Gossypium hirsutum]